VSDQTIHELLHRRLVRDYEARTASGTSRVYWAMTDDLSCRITRTTTPTWRAPIPSSWDLAE